MDSSESECNKLESNTVNFSFKAVTQHLHHHIDTITITYSIIITDSIIKTQCHFIYLLVMHLGLAFLVMKFLKNIFHKIQSPRVTQDSVLSNDCQGFKATELLQL